MFIIVLILEYILQILRLCLKLGTTLYKLFTSLKDYYYPKKIHVNENIYLEYKEMFNNIFINNLDFNLFHLKLIYKYIFKDQIVIFINSKYYDNTSVHIYNYENCNLNLKKHKNFIVKKTYYDDDNWYLNYYLKYYEFDNYINKEQIDKINNKSIILKKINTIDSNYYEKIVNFDNSIKVYYDYFVNMFNNYDKNIIYIGLYGKSGTGKTMFLRNIINILEKYNKNYCTINNLYSAFTYIQISNNINRFISANNYHPITVIICTTDDFTDDIFKKIKQIKNIHNINKKKIIILFETIQYTDYFNDFDITFETKYQKKLI
jgi:hypothetical protein